MNPTSLFQTTTYLEFKFDLYLAICCAWGSNRIRGLIRVYVPLILNQLESRRTGISLSTTELLQQRQVQTSAFSMSYPALDFLTPFILSKDESTGVRQYQCVLLHAASKPSLA